MPKNLTILGIETSCDETACSVVSVETSEPNNPQFTILSNAVHSQIEIHKEFGGVFPALAKREHTKNIIHVLNQALTENSESFSAEKEKIILTAEQKTEITKILERENDLAQETINYIEKNPRPTIAEKNIDAIAVTIGPGLEPALWVGISFAKAIGYACNIPVIGINHMEGHIMAPLAFQNISQTSSSISFPALAVLISGGHTELVLVSSWGDYKIIGKTRDDAVGEAFDKVARMLNMPYPGGPEISKRAEAMRTQKQNETANKKKDGLEEKSTIILPRPMLHSPDFDFSFSGIKTAVLYLIRDLTKNSKTSDEKILTEDQKNQICLEFENAVTEVLISKTKKAIVEYGISTIIMGGGVTANTHIRREFQKFANEQNISLLLPTTQLSTDNAVMIAIAGYFNYITSKNISQELKADGNLSF